MATIKSGLESRRLALELLGAVLVEGRSLDDALDESDSVAIDTRDRAFAHAMAATLLRRKGEAEAVIRQHLSKPLPRSSGGAHLILLLGVAQLLFLGAPAHAVIDLSVTLAFEDRKARHFTKLINAVLRKVADQGTTCLSSVEAGKLNTPSWLMKSWSRTYGEETAKLIAQSHLAEAPLDITVKEDAEDWAVTLGASLLPSGSLRLVDPGRIELLPGYDVGAWWIQDAAAALPARLMGELKGQCVLDLCAAPGGKTAQLAAAGARVTAVDHSAQRLNRIATNLARLKLAAELVCDDVLKMPTGVLYDAVLLDAPCSATGTIRRHPDLPYLKSAQAVRDLAFQQKQMLDKAASLVGPRGILLYCTCSLQPEECVLQAEAFLARQPGFRREPIGPDEVGGQTQFISDMGDLRTLPFMAVGDMRGVDGFFAARFRRV